MRTVLHLLIAATATLIATPAAADSDPFVLGTEAPAKMSYDARDFSRVIDVTAGLKTEEAMSLCVGAHPWQNLEVNGCVGSSDFALGAPSLVWGVSSSVYYRKSIFFTRPGLSSLYEASIGGGVGGSRYEACFSGCGRGWTVGPRVSTEITRWWRSHLGLTAQLDVGANLQVRDEPTESRQGLFAVPTPDVDMFAEIDERRSIIPYASLTIGMSF